MLYASGSGIFFGGRWRWQCAASATPVCGQLNMPVRSEEDLRELRWLIRHLGGEVAVIELFSESLGDAGSGADTYIGMMRTNTDLIVGALAGS